MACQVPKRVCNVIHRINDPQHHPTSPNITQHHPTSPNIIQHHPTSPNITQHHPTSPNIIQHHPTSPNITQHHPTSPNKLVVTCGAPCGNLPGNHQTHRPLFQACAAWISRSALGGEAGGWRLVGAPSKSRQVPHWRFFAAMFEEL